MSLTRRTAILGGAVAAVGFSQQPSADKYPDVPFIPTPVEVIDEMLKLAEVRSSDVVYDLGCGDGRIVVAAAQKFGATGVGMDIDADLIREARQRAVKAGVANKVKFLEGDLFESDIRPATVVTMYLLPRILDRLKPKLLAELKPGTRIVSFSFNFKDWPPLKAVEFTNRRLYLWVVPQPGK